MESTGRCRHSQSIGLHAWYRLFGNNIASDPQANQQTFLAERGQVDFDVRFEWLLRASQTFGQIDLDPLRIGCCRDQVSELFGRLLVQNRLATFGSVQILDQSLHSIVDAADPNASLIAIQSEHHRFLVVDGPHEVIGVISQRNNLHFALIDARLVDVFHFVNANFNRAFLDANRSLQFVIQRQMRMVF